MKAVKASLGAALDRPNPTVRFYLFHGPDESQSRALADRLLRGLAATKFVIAGSAVRSDPALLADEAAAISLFGGTRLVWIEPAGEDIQEGVSALLQAGQVESPVVAIAGGLRKSSALLKLAESHRLALTHASYTPEGRDADRMVDELARSEGLRLAPGVAARIAASSQGDRGLASQEIVKLAIYAGASPDHPAELAHGDLDAVGADVAEGDFTRLADLALTGELGALAAELGRLSESGSEAIPVLRSAQRRLLLLAPIRARIERGEKPDAVMAAVGKSLFWKDKATIDQLVRIWDAQSLARLGERLGRLERDLMLKSGPSGSSLGEELTAIARAAKRR